MRQNGIKQGKAGKASEHCRNPTIRFVTKCEVQRPMRPRMCLGVKHTFINRGECKGWSPMTSKCTPILRIALMQKLWMFRTLSTLLLLLFFSTLLLPHHASIYVHFSMFPFPLLLSAIFQLCFLYSCFCELQNFEKTHNFWQQTKTTFNGYSIYFHPWVFRLSHLFFGLPTIF